MEETVLNRKKPQSMETEKHSAKLFNGLGEQNFRKFYLFIINQINNLVRIFNNE